MFWNTGFVISGCVIQLVQFSIQDSSGGVFFGRVTLTNQYFFQPLQINQAIMDDPLPPIQHNLEIDLKCGEKVTDSDSEGIEARDYLTHHDHTRRPKPIKAR